MVSIAFRLEEQWRWRSATRTFRHAEHTTRNGAEHAFCATALLHGCFFNCYCFISTNWHEWSARTIRMHR
jgi:hypothetical protein